MQSTILNRRWLPLVVLLSLLGVTVFSNTSSADEVEKRPNIVLVIADDMTYNDCGAYGNKDVKTPNIDALAEVGVCFDRCFTTTAMCSPTRQQLYTGLFPVRSGAYPNHSRVKKGTKSMVHHFKELGYRVALIGKRHIGPESSFPFEYLSDAKPAPINMNAVEKFLAEKSTKPFFLVMASHDPHSPWTMGDAAKYIDNKIKVPGYLVDTPATREALTKYYAEITHLDQQIGELNTLLKKTGHDKNTISVFTTEQGSSLPFGKWTCYDAGLQTGLIVSWPGRIKGGERRQAMVQYVDILPTLLELAGGDPAKMDTGRPGKTLAGQPTTGFDGKSFARVLTGDAKRHRDVVYGVHTTRGIINGSDYPVRSIRDERYKLIVNLNPDATFTNVVTKKSPVLESWQKAEGPGQERAKFYQHRPAVELYDLQNDPWEQKNLAELAKYQEVKKELRTKLDAWMASQGDLGMGTEMKVKTRPARKKPKK